MGKTYTFPHYNVEIWDQSITEVYTPEELPLHCPIFFGFAEKGEIGKPVFGNTATHMATFGKGTFDQYSKWFKHPNLFFKEALSYQQAFFVRVATADAATAVSVLEAHVKEDVQITQYEKDEEGGIKYDASGDKIPLTDQGVIVTETGMEITWVLRALTADESVTSLTPKNVDGVMQYPILAMEATSPGAWANKAGLRMWFDWSTFDQGMVENVGSLLFNLAIVEQPYGYDTAQPVRNLYNNPTTEVSFMPDAIDVSTERRVYLDDIIDNDYTADDLPFEFTLFSDNVETISTKIQALEPNLATELTSPWLVDIMSATTLEGHPYDHVNILYDGTEGATALDEDVIQYLSGGSDGTISDDALYELTEQWLGGNVFPDITDSARYPITHLWDSGYPLTTKKAMVDFIGGVRDDVKAIFSTQDVTNPANTKEEDQSTGSAIRASLLLYPESTVYGTRVCRGTILQQCGKLADNPNWKQIVPATFDCLRKKCYYQGLVYFRGKPKGLPQSEVTCFSWVNWFPNSNDHKQLSWENGLNWMQHYNMHQIHYADVRSVYPYETSLISDDIFVDQLVYLKHIARHQWSIFAGRDENPSLLFGEIEESISAEIYEKFGNFLKVEVSVYQTDKDKLLGYASTIELIVYGNMSQRVWNVIIPVRRDTEEG